MNRNWKKTAALWITVALCLSGCGKGQEKVQENTQMEETSMFTLDTRVKEVMDAPVFQPYGRLIFPVDMRVDDTLTLKDVEDILPWYSEINPDKTVEIVNDMRERAAAGQQIFYDIYTEEEKREDPDKEDTGLFFFRGEKNAKTAILNAGGGMAWFLRNRPPMRAWERGTELPPTGVCRLTLTG